MTKQVNLYEAKTQLSRLVDEAAQGAEIVIAKNGKPMARLVAPEPAKTGKRELGQWAKFMTPEELAYHSSAQFDRDWKQWDAEIARDFEVLQDEGRKYTWDDTSSTPTRSSERKKGRTSSAPKPAKQSKTRKTRSS
jgi:prevent-host-death family protein